MDNGFLVLLVVIIVDGCLRNLPLIFLVAVVVEILFAFTIEIMYGTEPALSACARVVALNDIVHTPLSSKISAPMAEGEGTVMPQIHCYVHIERM